MSALQIFECNCCSGPDPSQNKIVLPRIGRNYLYTFGGKWNEGNRRDIASWENNPDLQGLGIISTDPRRVPKVRGATSLLGMGFFKH